jgi:hypothetical protein
MTASLRMRDRIVARDRQRIEGVCHVLFHAGSRSEIRPVQRLFRHREDAVVEGVTQIHRVAILVPLAVGAVAVLCTIFVHAVALGATVNFLRYERRLGRAGAGMWIDLFIVILTMSFAFVAHLMEIALWALLFMICGEFQGFGIAYYHSAVNYTTLGYGDVVMSPSWRLLGPLEAADGALMFGVSTAMVFSVIARVLQMRYVDLRD